jgi:hypothetical protein
MSRAVFVEGCRRTLHTPGYAEHSLRQLRVDDVARQELLAAVRALDAAYPDDPVTEREGVVVAQTWSDVEVLVERGVKCMVVDPLSVAVYFAEGRARTAAGEPLLWILEYSDSTPDELTAFDHQRLGGLKENVADHYDAEFLT